MGQGKNLAAARATYPDLFAIVDATEQPVQRSADPEQQKQHYSGKRKRHTRKVQIIVNEHGVARGTSVTRSPAPCMTAVAFPPVLGAAAAIPKETITGGDAGYQGIQDDLPDHSVITPFKKTKLHPLSEEQKLLNQEFSRTRITVVESWPNSKTSRLWLNAFVMILTAGMMSSERYWPLSIHVR